jgi:peptide deformylase
MTVREIRLFGDPVLKSVCDPVKVFDSKIAELALDLLETTTLISGRAGVAANQIGVGLRGFSWNVDGKSGVIFNPKIVELSGERRLVQEGCLSVPGLWHETPRYEYAKVEGFNATGEPIVLEGFGLMAQALQHECDHLDGLVYLDRLEPEERKLAMKNLRATDWFMRG